MVDVAHIVLRKTVRNFVFGEFCEEISPALQKPAGVRSPRQTKYNFHFNYLNHSFHIHLMFLSFYITYLIITTPEPPAPDACMLLLLEPPPEPVLTNPEMPVPSIAFPPPPVPPVPKVPV